MKALVIDNEANIRESVVEGIKAFCPQITQIHEADGIDSGLHQISTFKPDIVFLDVELGNGTGMDLLSKLSSITFQLVFVTAHNKYAIDAFKFSAIDFLLKPIDPSELIRSVTRAERKANSDNILKQLDVLSSSISSSAPAKEKKIVLSEQDSIHILNSTDIIYCSSDGNYTSFFSTSKADKIVISKNMKYFEEMLSPLGFIRVHNSYLVNVNKIEKYDKGDGGFLHVSGGAKIPVSQRKKEQLMTLLKHM